MWLVGAMQAHVAGTQCGRGHAFSFEIRLAGQDEIQLLRLVQVPRVIQVLAPVGDESADRVGPVMTLGADQFEPAVAIQEILPDLIGRIGLTPFGEIAKAADRVAQCRGGFDLPVGLGFEQACGRKPAVRSVGRQRQRPPRKARQVGRRGDQHRQRVIGTGEGQISRSHCAGSDTASTRGSRLCGS